MTEQQLTIPFNRRQLPDSFVAWLAFHRDNPEVWKLFVEYATKTRNKGHKRFSARTLFGAIRYECEITTTDANWKINNYFTPYYARLLMLIYPNMFADFFEVRAQKEKIADEDLLRFAAEAMADWEE